MFNRKTVEFDNQGEPGRADVMQLKGFIVLQLPVGGRAMLTPEQAQELSAALDATVDELASEVS